MSEAPTPKGGRRRTWLVPGLITLSFLLFIAFQWMGAGALPAAGGASPRSKGAVGFAGWAELCDRAGYPVVFDGGVLQERATTESTVVRTSPGIDAVEEPTPIRRDTIWVISKYRATEHDPTTGWSYQVGHADLGEEQRTLAELGVDVTFTRHAASVDEVRFFSEETLAVELSDVVTVSGTDLVPVVTCSEGALVARTLPLAHLSDDPDWPGPSVWIVAEPDLLANQGLWRAEHAEIALGLVRRVAVPDSPLIFDLSVHGEAVGRSFWRELREFPLVLLPIHLALLLVLSLWAGMVRFGPALMRPTLESSGRRTLIRNTAQLLISCGFGPASVRRYVEASIDVVAERYRLPRRGGAAHRARALLPLCESHETEVTPVDLLAEAQRLEALPSRRERGRLSECLALARRTHAWREELLDGS